MTAFRRQPRDPDRLELTEFDTHTNAVWDRYLTKEKPAAGKQVLGICCSGGGIRSASYNLGALQVLRQSGHLAAAKYLAAVSGGTYISAAHAAIASLSDEQVFEDGPPPWAPGSPEERHLRNHSRYLTEGPGGHGGRFWAGSAMVWGLLAHLMPLVLATFLAGRVLGAGLDLVSPRVNHSADAAVKLGAPWGVLGACAVALFVSFAALWLRRQVETGVAKASPTTLDALARVTSGAMKAAVAIAVVGLAVPELFAAVRHLRITGFVAGRHYAWATDSNLVWGFLVAQGSALLGVAGAAWRMRRTIGRFAPQVCSVLGPFLLIGPLLFFAYQSAYDGFIGPRGAWMWAALAGAAGSMVLYAFFGHCVRWSLHLFYKERLSSVFMPKRERTEGNAQQVVFPYEEKIRMSGLQSPASSRAKMPELVVCAALNVSDSVVPPGRAADTFTFTKSEVGSPATGYVATTDFEDRAGHTPLTLPAMVAISGAALSPSMGHMTRPWARFALAVLNVRLGVWVPNPLRLDDIPKAKGLVPGSFLNGLARGWYEPGPLYVLFEALGRNTLKRRFVYITDGGHWENLGLVELLRRRCTRIVCLDAAGDSLSSFNTLAEAAALARSELQVDIEIKPVPDLLPDDSGFSPQGHVVGDITYPDGLKGKLVFVKAAMSADAPWDVKAYHATHPQFPCEGTMDQFFDDAQFRAYQALGAHAATGAVTALEALDPPAPADEQGDEEVIAVDEILLDGLGVGPDGAFLFGLI